MTADPRPRLDAVVAAVCHQLDVKRLDLLGRSRMRHLVQARQLAMSFSCEFLGLSVSVVARYFGRDRATVYHATQVTRQRLEGDARHASLRAAWNYLKREITPMVTTPPHK